MNIKVWLLIYEFYYLQYRRYDRCPGAYSRPLCCGI